VLALSGGRLRRIAFAANGTRIDGWLLDTNQNHFQRAGDMNGDGRAEAVIRSPWGVGIMGLNAADAFRCYSMFPFGSVLKDWYLQSGDAISGAGNLAGAANRTELLFLKP